MAAPTPAIPHVTPVLTPRAIPAPLPPAALAIRNVGPAQQMQLALDMAPASTHSAYSRLASSHNVTKPPAPTLNVPRPPASHAQRMPLAPPPATCSANGRLR